MEIPRPNKLCANTKRLHAKETSKDKNEEECFQHIETTIFGHNHIITAVLLDRVAKHVLVKYFL